MGRRKRRTAPAGRDGRSDPMMTSAAANNLTYNQYYNQLTELGINLFKWNNLPPSCDERYLELTLFTEGMALFFFDEELQDYLALQTMIGGNLNVYNIPIERTAYAANGYQNRKTSTDSVIIFNNFTHTNCLMDVELYAQRLMQIQRAIDVNISGQRFPLLITGTENQRLTLRNLYMKYDGNEPFIFGDDLSANAITAIKTDAPFVADKLWAIKRQTLSEALTYLGINANSSEKKEREITNEVSANYEKIAAFRLSRLNARQQAAEQINRMFGLNISVEYRTEIIEEAYSMLESIVPDNDGGVENE